MFLQKTAYKRPAVLVNFYVVGDNNSLRCHDHFMQLHLTPNGVSYLSINVIHTLPEKEETRLKAVNLPDVKTIKITSYKITPILHRSAFPVYGSTKMRIVYKSHSPKFNT